MPFAGEVVQGTFGCARTTHPYSAANNVTAAQRNELRIFIRWQLQWVLECSVIKAFLGMPRHVKTHLFTCLRSVTLVRRISHWAFHVIYLTLSGAYACYNLPKSDPTHQQLRSGDILLRNVQHPNDYLAAGCSLVLYPRQCE